MSEQSRRNLLMGTAIAGAAGAFGLPRAKAIAAPDPGEVGLARWLEGAGAGGDAGCHVGNAVAEGPVPADQGFTVPR